MNELVSKLSKLVSQKEEKKHFEKHGTNNNNNYK